MVNDNYYYRVIIYLNEVETAVYCNLVKYPCFYLFDNFYLGWDLWLRLTDSEYITFRVLQQLKQPIWFIYLNKIQD